MRLQFRFDVLIPCLAFCRCLRSCDMQFLYHDIVQTEVALIKPPRATPTAARRLPDTAASAPRHPPSHRRVGLAETPHVEPRAFLQADGACACHHRASTNSESALASQSAPIAHTRSIRHR